jgi:hypothetical protein
VGDAMGEGVEEGEGVSVGGGAVGVEAKVDISVGGWFVASPIGVGEAGGGGGGGGAEMSPALKAALNWAVSSR